MVLMNQINRRDAIMGVGAIAGLNAIGAPTPLVLTQAQAAQRANNNPQKRVLTVIEQPAAEIEEMNRLQGAINDAAMAAHRYEQGLKDRYRESIGAVAPEGHDQSVEVSFQEGYVFIRDYRAMTAEKNAAVQQQGAEITALYGHGQAVQFADQRRYR